MKFFKCCFNISGQTKKAVWVVNNKCNLFCKHCMKSSSLTGLKEEIDIKKVLCLIEKLKSADINYVVFSGGEPLLISNLDTVFSLFKRNGINFSLCTNAVLADRGKIDKFKKAGLEKCTISLDGFLPWIHDEFRGRTEAFKEAIEGIKNFKSNNISVTVNVTLHNKILRNLESFFQLLKDLDVVKVSFTYPMIIGRMSDNVDCITQVIEKEEQISETLRSLSETYKDLDVRLHKPNCNSDDCPSGKQMFSINNNRDIQGCPEYKRVFSYDDILAKV